MAEEQLFRDIQVTSSDIEVRTIKVDDLWQALKAGYDDFKAKPTFVFFLFVTYPLFALLVTWFLVGDNLPYLIFPIVAGFTLLGPVISVGLFEISRRRERGLDLSWRSAFNFIHTASFAPIVALSVMMMLLYLAWVFMAEFIYFDRFGVDPPASLSAFLNELFSTQRGAALIVYGNAIGFLFAFTALAISAIAFPLLLDKPVTSLTAISTSIRAVTNNLMVMALWGVIVVVSLTVGALVFLVGLGAALPILGHSTWHLYRRIVEP